MHYTAMCQRENRYWYYGEDANLHWVDNFHTGYNLDSLAFYITHSNDEDFRPYLRRGLAFYKANFFEDDGCPKYYHNRTYPVDIQCAAQSIDTLSLFYDRDEECLQLVTKVADWTLRNMRDATGYFYYRLYPLLKAKTPMLHWGQATRFRALSHFLFRLRSAANS